MSLELWLMKSVGIVGTLSVVRGMGVVEGIVAGQTPLDRLTYWGREAMSRIATGERFVQLSVSRLGHPEGVVEFEVGRQAAIAGDQGT